MDPIYDVAPGTLFLDKNLSKFGACAFTNGILITHNTKEFERISGLYIEDWVK
jgi:hypothetical protein